MPKIAAFFLTFLLTICPLSAGTTVENTVVSTAHPFLEMLSHIPADAAYTDSIPDLSYIDYRAIEQARPGVPSPQNWSEFSQLGEDARGLWTTNSTRINSGPGIFNYFSQYETLPEVMGFDFFDINRALTYGNPPETVFMYQGDFDADSIAAAHIAREYTVTEFEGVELWCGSVGCENGMQQDLLERNLANIFGGDLGREFPFVLMGNTIITSASLPNLEAAVSAEETILDVPAYRAIAEASTRTDNLLVQVQIYGVMDVGFSSDIGMPEGYAEQVEAMGILPAYELAALVDMQEGSDQLAMMILVYQSEEDAQQAAEELTARLETFAPLSTRSDEAVIDFPGVQGQMDEAQVYYSEAADRWVAIAIARYPMPDNEPDENGLLRASGMLYRFWIQALMRRELTPLLVKPE